MWNEEFLDAQITLLNSQKFLFTPGPASISAENFHGLDSAFGRGDARYEIAEREVIAALRSFSGQDTVVRFQGSASLALEIMTLNFLQGRVVLVDTGFYSDRLFAMIESALRQLGKVSQILRLPWSQIEGFAGRADWVVSAPVETSKALGIPISRLRALADRVGARLMLDATASIGLEDDHDLADVLAFSSCKGLFGFTGAAFLAYSHEPQNYVDSFYLSVDTHKSKMMTGPYHAILSLGAVVKNHGAMAEAVVVNKERCLKKFADHVVYSPENQPLLCTGLYGKVTSFDSRAILYQPRGIISHSVVCHLGEVHLGALAKGEILEVLELDPGNESRRRG